MLTYMETGADCKYMVYLGKNIAVKCQYDSASHTLIGSFLKFNSEAENGDIFTSQKAQNPILDADEDFFNYLCLPKKSFPIAFNFDNVSELVWDRFQESILYLDQKAVA